MRWVHPCEANVYEDPPACFATANHLTLVIAIFHDIQAVSHPNTAVVTVQPRLALVAVYGLFVKLVLQRRHKPPP
jgi:hypothetical protein